jgi:hypothetical protein
MRFLKKTHQKRLTIPRTRIHSPPAQKRVAPLNRERFTRRSDERDLSEHQAGLEQVYPGSRVAVPMPVEKEKAKLCAARECK